MRAQIDATKALIIGQQHSLQIMQHQQAMGQIAGADVAVQQVALAQMQQNLPPLEKQLAQTRDLLAALGGHLPADITIPDIDLASLTLPTDVPVSLPSKLVEQRADVRAAEENLYMASAQIGVAVAAQLPNITLSASPGTVATQLGELVAPGDQFWSIGAGITQTLFDGGILAHRTQAARDTYDQVAALYRGMVITAFQNVADVLHALQSDGDNLKAAMAAYDAATHALAIVRNQARLGQANGLSLLVAAEAQQQAHLVLIQAQAARLSDTAALFASLGGSWQDKLPGENDKRLFVPAFSILDMHYSAGWRHYRGSGPGSRKYEHTLGKVELRRRDELRTLP